MNRRSLLLQGSAFALSLHASGRAVWAQNVGLKARGVYAAPGLSFGGIFVANALKLWSANGLDAELRQTQGGPLSMAAMTNHEADFAGVASSDPVIGWDKGIKTLTVAAFTSSLVAQFSARNDWLEKAGVGPGSSLQDKLKALRGARIGASTIGGGPAQYTRYLARWAGLDSDKDIKVLAVGFGAARMAALRTNQVDLTIGDSPEADQIEMEGYGKLFINCAEEIPFFKEFPYTVLTVTQELAEQKPDLVKGVVHVIGQANDLIAAGDGRAIDILKSTFPSIAPMAIERSMQRDHAAYPKEARMTESMWKNNISISAEMKMISKALPDAEGTIWTNKFIA